MANTDINISSTGFDSIENSVINVPGPTQVPNTNNNSPTITQVEDDPSIQNTENELQKLPLPNELRDFASYNYIFTLSCLTNKELNSPDTTYRVGDPLNIIIRSGGGVDNKIMTLSEQVGGKVEYFIDNVEIDSLIAQNRKTKQSNATSVMFTVTEPYSMGLFLQSLQIAAIKCGYGSYLSARYLLTVSFKGWDQNGNPIELAKSRRMFPLKFSNIDFEVTEAGSTYNVTAVPHNEEAFTDQVQTMKADIQLQGKNVFELCQTGGHSIAAKFNDRELRRKQEGEILVPNEYVIIFPKARNSVESVTSSLFEEENSVTIDPTNTNYRELSQEQRKRVYETISGATNEDVPDDFDPGISQLLGIIVKRSNVGESLRQFADNPENCNEIGQAVLVDDYLDGNTQPFGKPKFIEVEGQPGVFERGKIQIQKEKSVLTFKARSTIQDMIEEIILLSSYGKKIAEDQPDDKGFINWFKIEANVFVIDSAEQEAQSGDHPKIFVYRVLPYKAHISRFSTPTKASYGLGNIYKQICKRYFYIYSGLNDDVLDFSIKFDSAFYTSITPRFGKDKAGPKIADSNRMAGDYKPPTVTVNTGIEPSSTSGVTNYRDDVRPYTGSLGGGIYDSQAISVARDFNDALMNSPTDLVGGVLKIWGDPYFIADSGMGNYSARSTPVSINLTEDGTMDYQESEVHILLEFRSPFDYNLEGGVDFMDDGRKATSAFSGIYHVISVLNRFSEGIFTQELNLIRIKNQPDFDILPNFENEETSEGNLLATVTKTDAAGRILGGI